MDIPKRHSGSSALEDRPTSYIFNSMEPERVEVVHQRAPVSVALSARLCGVGPPTALGSCSQEQLLLNLYTAGRQVDAGRSRC